jgi:putative ABC transport system ATP-binding protein
MAILGPSGSGKTTLLGLCAGLDRASSGSVLLDGNDLGAMDEDRLAALRNERVGFIFQSFQLLPTLTALENVMVPLELRGEDAGKRALELLDHVGLGERASHYPVQLSGGEQQRVAIARAFINEPGILFADEPTGNLDGATAARVRELLFDIQSARGSSLVLVTHDEDLARRTDAILRLAGGRVVAGTGA